MLDVFLQAEGPEEEDYNPDALFIWLYEEDGSLYAEGSSSDVCWLYEYQETGWDQVMDVTPHQGDTIENWLLLNGLAPGQRFLVRLERPTYYQCNSPMDPEEWDVDLGDIPEILAIEKWSDERVAEAWHEWLDLAPGGVDGVLAVAPSVKAPHQRMEGT